MAPLTRKQREALLNVYRRQPELNAPNPRSGNPGRSYLQFRRTALSLTDCVMVPYCNMWLGIETDGYTHS